MAIDPRTVDEATTDLENSLKGEIDKLTNFLSTSFNNTWISSFSESVHDNEVLALVAQMSGWVEYAGKQDIDQTDLDKLNVDGADPDEINDLMEDSQLDNLGKLVGVERDPGQKSTGKVTVQTATDDTRVPEGMEVTTVPDSNGDYLSYFVDADGDGEIGDSGYVTPSTGNTEVQVDIIAEETGKEHNVGAGSITRLPDPPVGVEGVNNNSATTGGEPEQTNDEYREDIQNAVFESSGGGTVAGVEGAVEENAANVKDVALDEFLSRQPPEVDVIVDGGSDSDVNDAIANARPVGIKHNLVRPEDIFVGERVELIGKDIDTTFVRNQISDYLLDLTLGGNFLRSVLTQIIMNSDDSIDDIASLTSLLTEVNRESEQYVSGTTIYELDFAPLAKVDGEERLYRSGTSIYDLGYIDVNDTSVTVTAIVNGDEVDLTNGTDYDVIDDDGDGKLDAIDFSLGGDSPDDETVFEVEYTHNDWTIDSTITDGSGDSFTQGTDWALVDNDGDGLNDSIDWGIGGSSPSDGELFFVDYKPKRVILRDQSATKREKITYDSGATNILTYDI